MKKGWTPPVNLMFLVVEFFFFPSEIELLYVVSICNLHICEGCVIFAPN